MGDEGGVSARKLPKLKMNFGEINEANLEQFRVLNKAILPVRYTESFYQNILHFPQCLCKYAYLSGLVVGAIACRVEKDGTPLSSKDVGGTKVYIMTLGVLPAYRGRGIGKQLVESILEALQKEDELPGHDLESIYLHVQTSNKSAQKFYAQFGFEVKEEIKGYYKRIDPPDCFVLEKPLAGKKKGTDDTTAAAKTKDA